jgi:hypothetical protein
MKASDATATASAPTSESAPSSAMYKPDTPLKTIQDWRDESRIAVRKIPEHASGAVEHSAQM